MMGGAGLGMLGIGVLIMIAFWVLIIGGVVWLVVTLARGSHVAAADVPACVGPDAL